MVGVSSGFAGSSEAFAGPSVRSWESSQGSFQQRAQEWKQSSGQGLRFLLLEAQTGAIGQARLLSSAAAGAASSQGKGQVSEGMGRQERYDFWS